MAVCKTLQYRNIADLFALKSTLFGHSLYPTLKHLIGFFTLVYFHDVYHRLSTTRVGTQNLLRMLQLACFLGPTKYIIIGQEIDKDQSKNKTEPETFLSIKVNFFIRMIINHFLPFNESAGEGRNDKRITFIAKCCSIFQLPACSDHYIDIVVVSKLLFFQFSYTCVRVLFHIVQSSSSISEIKS